MFLTDVSLLIGCLCHIPFIHFNILKLPFDIGQRNYRDNMKKCILGHILSAGKSNNVVFMADIMISFYT